MTTFGERVKAFNRSLGLDAILPPGVAVMNPFRESPLALRISEAFYDKFYHDNERRHLILGINPGRFDALTEFHLPISSGWNNIAASRRKASALTSFLLNLFMP